MTKAEFAKSLEGKTIKKASFARFEASDSCIVGTVGFEFTDGSEFNMRILCLPQVHGILFKSDKDDDKATEVKLI